MFLVIVFSYGCSGWMVMEKLVIDIALGNTIGVCLLAKLVRDARVIGN